MVPGTGSALYYAEDTLGSSRVIVQSNGTLCYDADFTPFGGERTYTSTCAQNYKFEGKERDTETQNDDFGARYYSWRIGRWLSSDWSAVPVPVPYANLTNPQTLNLYSMVGDDPESFADLDGHGPQTDPHTVTPGNCPGQSGPNPCATQAQPAAQNNEWSLSWQVNASATFLGQELKGVYDVTLGPVVDAAEHPVQTVENAASNFVEGVKDVAKDPKGTLTGAAEGAKDLAVQFGSQVASGNPRAIGQAVGIAATAAYTAENVRVGAYEHGGGGANLKNTPFNGNRLAVDYHPFGKAGTAAASKNVLHVDIKIQQLGINVRHWTPW